MKYPRDESVGVALPPPLSAVELYERNNKTNPYKHPMKKNLKVKTSYKVLSENFCLTLFLETFEDDITMSLLHVDLTSDGFSVKTNMDIFTNDFVQFVYKMQDMYKTLKGEAMINEPYGMPSYLKFAMDITGHVVVKGELSSGENGHLQHITIENDFDQTSLEDFLDIINV